VVIFPSARPRVRYPVKPNKYFASGAHRNRCQRCGIIDGCTSIRTDPESTYRQSNCNDYTRGNLHLSLRISSYAAGPRGGGSRADEIDAPACASAEPLRSALLHARGDERIDTALVHRMLLLGMRASARVRTGTGGGYKAGIKNLERSSKSLFESQYPAAKSAIEPAARLCRGKDGRHGRARHDPRPTFFCSRNFASIGGARVCPAEMRAGFISRYRSAHGHSTFLACLSGDLARWSQKRRS
jgi:hypothetical protein